MLEHRKVPGRAGEDLPDEMCIRDRVNTVLDTLEGLSPAVMAELGNPATGGATNVAAFDQSGSRLWSVTLNSNWLIVQIGGESERHILEIDEMCIRDSSLGGESGRELPEPGLYCYESIFECPEAEACLAALSLEQKVRLWMAFLAEDRECVEFQWLYDAIARRIQMCIRDRPSRIRQSITTAA